MINYRPSWLTSNETHVRPTSSANCCTKADLPMPGAPQIKTGLTGAIFNNISDKSLCVTVIGKFINMSFPKESFTYGRGLPVTQKFYCAVFRCIVSFC